MGFVTSARERFSCLYGARALGHGARRRNAEPHDGRPTPATTGFRPSVVHLPPERNESRKGLPLEGSGGKPSTPGPPRAGRRPGTGRGGKRRANARGSATGRRPRRGAGGERRQNSAERVQTALDGAPGFVLPGAPEVAPGDAVGSNRASFAVFFRRGTWHLGRAPEKRMSNLDPQADKAVHDAVDAFMEGRLDPEFAGETVFETKNSRYRLLDGVVFAAPSDALLGAELVGWLMETTRRSVVGSAWQPGARAVLVDRHRGRNIIVTVDDAPPPSGGARCGRPGHDGGAGHGPAPDPAGCGVDPSRGAGSTAPARHPLHAASAADDRAASSACRPAAASSSPVQSAAILQKRAAAVHLPPRPIVMTALPLPARPLPAPAPPPRREGFQASPFPHVNPPQQPPEAASWELTSSGVRDRRAENTEPGPLPGRR